MIWTEISINAWSIAFMLISLAIPAWIGLRVVRFVGGATKKTVRTLKK